MRHLSAMDAAFVHLESPEAPMHTTGITILDPSTAPAGFGFETLRELLAARLHLLPPFRQRLVAMPLGLAHPAFADDPAFELDNHLHHVALPAPGGMRELARLVGDVTSRPLDRDRPLWEMWVIEGLAGGRVAQLTKTHHCVIDGVSGANLMTHLLDTEPAASSARASAPRFRPAPLPSGLGLAAAAARAGLRNPLRAGRLLASSVRGFRALRQVQRETLAEGKPLPSFFATGPRLRSNEPLTPHRALAFARAPLDELRFIKKSFGATVNDAVLAACTLALRRYLIAHDDLPEADVICAVPVSVRAAEPQGPGGASPRSRKGLDGGTASEPRPERGQAERSPDHGNRVANMNVKLPVRLEAPEQVIGAIHAATRAAKRELGAIDARLLQDWAEFSPPSLLALSTRLLSGLQRSGRLPPLANLVVSNIPGPPFPLYMAGARVVASYGAGPLVPGQGINITVMSYCGSVDVCVNACRETVPDVWQLASGFEDAVTELRQVAEARVRGEASQPR